MGFTETLTFYAFIGAAIGVAVYLADGRRTGFVCATSVLFWPLYLPLLLSKRRAQDDIPELASTPELDEMAAAIAQVESELDAALSSLDGWAENALACEANRIAELCHALGAQAARIREMDHLLSRTDATEIDTIPKAQTNGSVAQGALERWLKSQQARANNLTRLAQVRRQTHADLMATLAWIRELVSMIHLAKFTGAPASRAEELVAQIAAAVEGVSAIAWQEIDLPADTASGLPATQSSRVEADKFIGAHH